jgi:hypothetical protein
MARTNEHRAALAEIGDLDDIVLALEANDLPTYLIDNVFDLDNKEAARAFAFQLGLRLGLDRDYADGLEAANVDPEDFLSPGAQRWSEKGQELAEYIIERAEEECEDNDIEDLDDDLDDDDIDDELGGDDDYRGYTNFVGLVAIVETADAAKAVAGLRTLLGDLTTQVGRFELGNVVTNGPTSTIELIPQGPTRAPISGMPAGTLIGTLTSLTGNEALVYDLRITGDVDANRLPREPQAYEGSREVTVLNLYISNENRFDLSDAAAEAGLRFALVNIAAVIGSAVVTKVATLSASQRVYTLSLNNDGVRDARILRNGNCRFDHTHDFPGHGTLRARLSVAN